jgi:uncharacterized membrane protein
MGAIRMVGSQPEREAADPPEDGPVHATTGNATATSPFTGTVVEGELDDVETDDAARVEAVVSRSEVPHPASTVRPSTEATERRRAGVHRRHRAGTGFLVMMHDDRPGSVP